MIKKTLKYKLSIVCNYIPRVKLTQFINIVLFVDSSVMIGLSKHRLKMGRKKGDLKDLKRKKGTKEDSKMVDEHIEINYLSKTNQK